MSVRNILMAAAASEAGTPPGQVLLLTGTTSWTVPAGVTSICVVAVQGGGTPVSSAGPVTVTVSGTVVCRAQNENRIGDGGGNAGTPGNGGSDYENYILFGGGSGAGGYSGNGGDGGSRDGGSSPVAATSGSGGGGGGGGWDDGLFPGFGGSVGLLGQGANGAAGDAGQNGGNGSSGTTLGYGAGARGMGNYYQLLAGGRGGALAYKNNIAVTPGQAVTLSIPETLSNAGPAAVRIIWGAGRGFPSTNTGDV